MKKIIVAEPLISTFERNDTVFGRGSISIYPARSSEEILNLHGTHRTDLIVTDSELPFMDSAKLCFRIRSDAGLKKVSIIVVCNADAASLALCRVSGANAVIPKPADPDTLFLRVSELLVVPQRKDMRVRMRISVKGLERDAFFAAQSQNISISGMLLESDRVLKKGDRLSCIFNIAHSEITVECVVTRAVKTGTGRQRYGVKFKNCDTKSLIIIDQYVKAQTKS